MRFKGIFEIKIMRHQELMADTFYSLSPKAKETSEQGNAISEAQRNSWKMMDRKIKLG